MTTFYSVTVKHADGLLQQAQTKYYSTALLAKNALEAEALTLEAEALTLEAEGYTIRHVKDTTYLAEQKDKFPIFLRLSEELYLTA